VTVSEKAGKDELRVEIEREHFVRAALLAASLGIGEEEIQDIRLKALRQISAEYRNAPGTKSLAQQYGFSKQKVKNLLEKYAEEKRKEGNDKVLAPCYDLRAGEYLSFEEWVDQLLKDWDK